jgi:F-type H+-transporting ATPase subunit epsilon
MTTPPIRTDAPVIAVEITTPDGVFLATTATLVELPGVNGQLGVMPGHTRLVTALETGPLTVHRDGRVERYFIGGGFARIVPDRISVLAIGIQTALDARILAGCCARARELLGDSYDLEALESACERARQLLAPTPARLPSAEPDDLAQFPREAILAKLFRPAHRSRWN